MKRTLLSFGLALGIALGLGLVGAEGTTVIEAADSGYMLPVVAIASGDSVAWRSVDNTHVTQDTPARGGDPCFLALSQEQATSGPVRFDLVDGVLLATHQGDTLACSSAVSTPGGATLAYHCLIHPLMRGAIAVTA